MSKHGDDRVGDAIQHMIVIFVLSMLAYTASGFWLSMTLGGIANGVFAKILKRVLKIPRPVPVKRATSGMPSSHSYLLFYFATVAVLERSNEIGGGEEALLVLAALICIHRVYYQYHTAAQCLVGACVGVCMAFIWTQSPLHVKLSNADDFDPQTLTVLLTSILVAGWGISKFRHVFIG